MAAARCHLGETELWTRSISSTDASGFPAAVLPASPSLGRLSTARRQVLHSAICASACALASTDSSRSTYASSTSRSFLQSIIVFSAWSGPVEEQYFPQSLLDAGLESAEPAFGGRDSDATSLYRSGTP